jgi:hypothetical protein
MTRIEATQFMTEILGMWTEPDAQDARSRLKLGQVGQIHPIPVRSSPVSAFRPSESASWLRSAVEG